MIKAVLFDLDGTLYDRDALVLELLDAQFAAFERDLAGVGRDAFVRRALEMDDHGYGEKRAGFAQLVDEWRLPPALAGRLEDFFWSSYDSYCRLSDDTRVTLGALRARGLKLGVITNGDAIRQPKKIEALGLGAAFDVVLVSAIEGVRKPDAEIFRRAVERCGVTPHEAAFVGDHPEADVEGARRAGLLPIWKAVPYWPAPPGVPSVERLIDVLSLL